MYLFARLQGRCAELQTQRNELSVMMLEMEDQGLLKDGMLGFFNLIHEQSIFSSLKVVVIYKLMMIMHVCIKLMLTVPF